MASRTLSERRRAFLAIGGVVFPRVGEVGLYSVRFVLLDSRLVDVDEAYRGVVVVRVSQSGATIWARFAHPEGQGRFGAAIYAWRRTQYGIYTRVEEPRGSVRF